MRGQLDHDDVAINLCIPVPGARRAEAVSVIVADHAIIVIIAAIITKGGALAVFIAFIIGALLIAATGGVAQWVALGIAVYVTMEKERKVF